MTLRRKNSRATLTCPPSLPRLSLSPYPVCPIEGFFRADECISIDCKKAAMALFFRVDDLTTAYRLQNVIQRRSETGDINISSANSVSRDTTPSFLTFKRCGEIELRVDRWSYPPRNMYTRHVSAVVDARLIISTLQILTNFCERSLLYLPLLYFVHSLYYVCTVILFASSYCRCFTTSHLSLTSQYLDSFRYV